MFKSLIPHKRTASSSAPPAIIDVGGGGKENRPQHPLATVTTAYEPQKAPASLFAGKISIAESPQRPMVKGPATKEGGRLVEAGAMNRAFEKMLDDMQIPSTLRPKLITLDTPVKAAMLKSSHTLNVVAPHPSPLDPPKFPSLRKAQSSESLLSSPTRPFGQGHTRSPSLDGGDFDQPLVAPRPLSSSFGTTSSYDSGSSGTGGLTSANASMEFLPHSALYPEVADGIPGDVAAAATKSKGKKANKDKAAKEKEKERELEQTPEAMAQWLASNKSTALDVERIRKLRVLLRNETASWSETFLRQGGYSALLGRLNELLTVEWREEQHDDQALHELLRCFKALSTSSIGCFALRSSCPTPFTQLTALLYSDKKPGDMASRQLIVDLLLILFELYPATKVLDQPGSIGRQRTAWDVKGSGHVIPPARPTVFTTPATSPAPSLPEPHESIFSLMRAILLTPRPAPSECPSTPVDPHAFIAALHRPRIYKTYLQELSDVRRDYFWVFCHQNNTIWDLAQTDEEKVEKPKAPGGMTGGVEFEAMTYLTTHFRLLNTLCKAAADLKLPASDEQSAYQLHVNLFESGLEKIILTSRKSSTTYYPNLHLEIGRYIVHTNQARFELPWSVSRLVGPPPAPLIRHRGAPVCVPSSPNLLHGVPPRPGSPTPPPRRSAPPIPVRQPPALPPPRRIEEIKF